MEDYAWALLGDNPLNLRETGVLKWFLGDLQGALEDLNAAAALGFKCSNIFKHQGYVKYLMGDKTGARKDGEYVKKLELKESKCWEICHCKGLNLLRLEKILVHSWVFCFNSL